MSTADPVAACKSISCQSPPPLHTAETELVHSPLISPSIFKRATLTECIGLLLFTGCKFSAWVVSGK